MFIEYYKVYNLNIFIKLIFLNSPLPHYKTRLFVLAYLAGNDPKTNSAYNIVLIH